MIKKIVQLAVLFLLLTSSACLVMNAAPRSDKGECRKHHCKLHRGFTGISYGYGTWEGRKNSYNKKYPNAKSKVGGGCITGRGFVAVIYYCRKCQKEKKRDHRVTK